nr:DNA-directed DNA polymerase [Tanacetum cinerariifolium]
MIHMPKGANVLKDILSHKDKLEKMASSFKLSEEYTAIIQRSLPQKEGDPGSFTLPCLIGPLAVKNALADIGASVNLMPRSLYRRLGISKLKPTKMSIQLSDRSIKYPIGVCENLLVKISKFIFPVDFIVLEMDEDELVRIILGRHFLATARAEILKSKHSHNDYLYCVDHTAKLVQEQWVDIVNHYGKWTKEKEEEDSNEALAVSFNPRIEPVEPLEWKAPENRLKPSSFEPPKLESKELPKHLEYAFLQENKQLPVVISSALSTVKKARLLEVLRNHKGAIAWSIADIKGIDSSFCTQKILMKDEFKPSVQTQRRVNPNIKEVVKKEVIKLLDAGLIYPISDSPCVSSIQVVLKKVRMTVVKNEKDELIPQRTVTGWRVFHIPIAPEDQEKTTFTCPYRTFAYRRMPFGLCNAPATFQRSMTAIFHELIKDSIEVSGSGIEVDKAKIKAISKLPYPTKVKSIRSFIGHAGFYRRFIKDFSQIACQMTHLLVKDSLFNSSKECIQAFNTLKHELTQAPIMIKPDWSLPFEIMCDASDYAVGAVLGQRTGKHFKPIHYARKKTNEAQENYTTIKKELLAVVFAFDKFSQYLGAENLAADHLCRLENPDFEMLNKAKIRDLFLEERVLIESYEGTWLGMRQHKFFDNVTADHLEDIMASPPPQEKSSRPGFSDHISFEMHVSWYKFAMHVNEQETSHQGMKHLRNTSKYAKFDVWGIDFMGPFLSSNENKYILVAIDYVLKWVEAQPFPTNDARNVVNFLKRLFARFGISKALISDRGTHFCNYQIEKAMKSYGVVHRFLTAYHPQMSGQVIFDENKLGSS